MPSRDIDVNFPGIPTGIMQRSAVWTVAVIPFHEGASMFADKGNLQKTKGIEILNDDVLSVNVNNSKSSFGKLCSITLKSSNIWWPSYVSPGDWICVWFHDSPQDAQPILDALKKLKSGNTGIGDILCRFDSGLKFAGRVLKMYTNDETTNQSRTIDHQIDCQAFIEFATSVYYTYAAQSIVNFYNTPSGTSEAAQNAVQFYTQGFLKLGLDARLKNLAENFLNKYGKIDQNGGFDFAPDTIVGLLYAIIMGIDPNQAKKELGTPDFTVSENAVISIPKEIAAIFGKPNSTKLWEIIDVHLGIQKYTVSSNTWYEEFQPAESTVAGTSNILRTPVRTEGFVPFTPTLWDNVSLWSILNQYLNPVVNEIYTVLRVNKKGRIVPTLVVREKPFSTQLYNHMKIGKDIEVNQSMETKPVPPKTNPTDGIKLGAVDTNQSNQSNNTDLLKSALDAQVQATKDQQIQSNSLITAAGGAAIAQGAVRTHFKEVPRWNIIPSMIRKYSFTTNESARVNFVMVWGLNAGAHFSKIDIGPEFYKQTQFNLGNSQADSKDIARNGLRAVILKSEFDYFTGNTSSSLAPRWAAKNADWLFNGHLKANATLTLLGVLDPICEGDNCQVGNLLYHIDAVSHNGSLSGGRKVFTTTLTLSNGILADSLDQADGPYYMIHLSRDRSEASSVGFTDTAIEGNNDNPDPYGKLIDKNTGIGGLF